MSLPNKHNRVKVGPNTRPDRSDKIDLMGVMVNRTFVTKYTEKRRKKITTYRQPK